MAQKALAPGTPGRGPFFVPGAPMNDETRGRPNGWWGKLSPTAKALAAIVAAAVAGAAGATWWATNQGIPARVTDLEAGEIEFRAEMLAAARIVDIRLRHLTCRANEEDAGRDPRLCLVILEQLPAEARQ